MQAVLALSGLRSMSRINVCSEVHRKEVDGFKSLTGSGQELETLGHMTYGLMAVPVGVLLALRLAAGR